MSVSLIQIPLIQPHSYKEDSIRVITSLKDIFYCKYVIKCYKQQIMYVSRSRNNAETK